MGSSIGLVVFQSRQFFYLNGLGVAALDNPGCSYLSASISSTFKSATIATLLTALEQFMSFIAPTWLPLTIWLLCLMCTSFLIKFFKWVPRVVSAKNAILLSQGCLQEVEEKVSLIGQRYAQEQVYTGSERNIQSMVAPLLVVWYVAVMVLGIATGLLTASSTILDLGLEMEYQDYRQQRLSDQEGDEYEYHVRLSDDEKHSETVYLMIADESITATSPSTTAEAAASPVTESNIRFTSMQRWALGALIFALFSFQMRFSQWIVYHGSLPVNVTSDGAGSHSGILASVSTSLTMFGLWSGMVMIILGVRLIPAKIDV
ncbi:hypothetical protein BGZ58_003502 [Dissophora ornata]|nr:hypothetical protein BGZ58_003502 [Dissophora ornata]